MTNRIEFHPKTRVFLSRLIREEWLALQASIDHLTDDAEVNNETIFAYFRAPIVYRLFYCPPFRIHFRFFAPALVSIIRIERAPQLPPVTEWGEITDP